MCVATFEPAAIASVATSEWVARAVERKVDRNLRTCTHSLGALHVTRTLPWMWRIVFCTRISCSTYLGTNIFCRHRSNCVEVAPPPRIRAESAAGESFPLAWPSVAPAAKTPLAPVVALPLPGGERRLRRRHHHSVLHIRRKSGKDQALSHFPHRLATHPAHACHERPQVSGESTRAAEGLRSDPVRCRQWLEPVLL